MSKIDWSTENPFPIPAKYYEIIKGEPPPVYKCEGCGNTLRINEGCWCTIAASTVHEIEPHYYSPDWRYQGDCRICGHMQDSGLHLSHISTNNLPRGTQLKFKLEPYRHNGPRSLIR